MTLIKRNQGYTLVEMLVVLGMIGIITAIGIPMFNTAEHKVAKAASALAADMQLTRMGAIKTNRTWRIEFDTDENSYRIIDNQIGSGDIVKTVDFDVIAPGVVYDGSFVSGDLPITYPALGGDIYYLSFSSLGTCQQDEIDCGDQPCYVYISNSGNAYKIGTLETGLITKSRL